MPASLLASYLIFILTGIYYLWGTETTLMGEIKAVVFAIALVNASFFFYFEAYAESDQRMRRSLRKAPFFEWLLRIACQAELIMLWFWLAEFGTIGYQCALVLLYITYTIWDIVVWNYLPFSRIAWLDLTGLAISSIQTIVTIQFDHNPKLDPDLKVSLSFFLGIISVAYLILTYVGIRLCKFNPFKIPRL